MITNDITLTPEQLTKAMCVRPHLEDAHFSAQRQLNLPPNSRLEDLYYVVRVRTLSFMVGEVLRLEQDDCSCNPFFIRLGEDAVPHTTYLDNLVALTEDELVSIRSGNTIKAKPCGHPSPKVAKSCAVEATQIGDKIQASEKSIAALQQRIAKLEASNAVLAGIKTKLEAVANI